MRRHVYNIIASGRRFASHRFFSGALTGAVLIVTGLHQIKNPQPEAVLAFTLVPITESGGKLAVIIVAVAFLVGFILWSKRAASTSFFRGVLAGMGFVLSVDIVWVHWIFGLHHITNTEMDIVLEHLFVFLGLVFLWFSITRERQHSA
jgi:hypothetical protein